MRRKFIGVAAMYCLGLLAGSLAPGTAAAQQYLLGGSGELGSGIEGGPPGAPAFSLARLRLRVALDVRVDEFPADIYAVGMLIELTPHSAFGFDVRYARRLGLKFEVNAGGVAYIAPESLFGPSAGLKYRMPLSATTHVTLGPEANVFVIGSDLPSGTIIWQVLVQAGFHADL